MPEKRKAHQHGEAFCLMHYRCTVCDHEEVFWNARDGMTPFVLSSGCPACGEDMLHVEWDQDEYAPEHCPEPGQGVWINTPPELIPVMVRLALSLYHSETGEDPPEGLAGAIQSQYMPGSPWLLRWEYY